MRKWALRADVAALLAQADYARQQDNWGDILSAAELARRAVALDPDSAAAWGLLALAVADQSGGVDGNVALAAVLHESDAAARRALALDLRNADAAAALLVMRPVVSRWAALDAATNGALQRAPDHADLLAFMARRMCDVARPAAAVTVATRLAARHPLRPMSHSHWAQALWQAGRVGEAEAVSARAAASWPGHGPLWGLRLRLLALGGKPEQALAFLRQYGDVTGAASGVPHDLALVLVQALQTRLTADVQAARAALVAARRARRVYSGAATQFAVALGDLDLAFDLVRGLFFDPDASGTVLRPRLSTAFLFTPPLQPLREDARFAGLTQALGLDDYWRAVAAPDFPRRRS